MSRQPAQPTTRTELAEQVGIQVAATYQFLASSRRRAAQAMARVRYVDRLLHSGGQRGEAAEPAATAQSSHVVDTVEHEVAAHERAVGLHEVAAQLQEDAGWPERAAAARAHAAHARESSGRAREELVDYQARAAAAQAQVDELHQRLP